MTPKREQQLRSLAELGYEVVRHGSLGLTLLTPQRRRWFLRWPDVGRFLSCVQPRKAKRKPEVYHTLAHLAARTPEPWEARRREYLSEVGRSERV